MAFDYLFLFERMEEAFLFIQAAPSGGFLTVLPPHCNLEHKELFKVLYSNLTLFNSASVISDTVEIFMERGGQGLAGYFPVHVLEIQSCICLQQVKNLQEFISNPIEKFSSIRKGNKEYQWGLLFPYRLIKAVVNWRSHWIVLEIIKSSNMKIYRILTN